jgi:uncharacterized membrane protein YcjF (UPF0283 family)
MNIGVKKPVKKIIRINTSPRTDLFYIIWLVTILVFTVIVLIGIKIGTYPRDLQFVLLIDILTGVSVFLMAILSTIIDITVSRFIRKKNENYASVFSSREIAGIVIVLIIVGSAYVSVKYILKNAPNDKSSTQGTNSFRRTEPDQVITITHEELLILTNTKRANNRLKPLNHNAYLEKAAQLKVEDMFQRNYLGT